MMQDASAALWPRMNRDQAMEILARFAPLDLTELQALSGTSTDDMTYYHLAHARVSPRQIEDVAKTIRMVAAKHGYPDAQSSRRRVEFDRELSAELFSAMQMLPADAADEGVWNYITLRVAPDVAFWRYPVREAEDGSMPGGNERHLGKPRNVFRRLWWRSYALTPELSSLLLEDEAVGLMERPTIGGYPDLARLVAKQQLEVVRLTGGAYRQDVLRDVLKRLRRVMGNRSVFALSSAQRVDLVRELFEESLISFFGESPFVTGIVHAPSASQPASGNLPLRIASPVATIELFKSGCGALWDRVRPYLAEPNWDDSMRLLEQLPAYRDANHHNFELASQIEASIRSLFDRWLEFSLDEQTVVVATASYFLASDDHLPDRYIGGLDDDDAVVDAAYLALGIRR